MDVGLGLGEFGGIPMEAEHGGGAGTHLHQADLADTADRVWIIPLSTRTTASAISGGKPTLVASCSRMARIIAPNSRWCCLGVTLVKATSLFLPQP
jgi:hypothetical protein